MELGHYQNKNLLGSALGVLILVMPHSWGVTLHITHLALMLRLQSLP
jgi:hypothetical protein